MDADDVWVIQRCERMGFFFKPCGKLRIVCTLWSEQFQRDEAVQRLLPRLVNYAHPTAAEAFENLELREVRREFLGRECRNCRRRFSALCRLHGSDHETAWAAAIHGIDRQGHTAERALGVGG